jgi:translocation and assembly module TamB
MASVPSPSQPRRAPPRWRDLGRLAARLLCALFALIGLIPLAGGLLLRSAPVHEWAARETARLLDQHLGLKASYSLELSLWPLRVAVLDLVVPSTAGGAAALSARSLAVRPSLFSLLAGRLDVGDIEVDELRVQLVVRDGKVTNVDYVLPEPAGDSAPLERAPFQTLALSDLRLDLDLDGTRVTTGPIDADVFAEAGPTFDVALRVSSAELSRERGSAVDEDVLCGLELRARYEPTQVLVRRLSLLGIADLDPARGSRGDCHSSGEQDPRRVAVRLSQLRVETAGGGLPRVAGHVFARAPLPLANRFADMAELHGWAGFSGDVAFDGETRLPRLDGQLSGAGLGLEGFRFAKTLDAKVELREDEIHLPSLRAGFADGDVHIQGARIAPFAPGGILEVPRLEVTGVKFPGLMRDLDVTPDTIVQWDIDDVVSTGIRGSLSPFAIDGKLEAETDRFAVFDDSWRAPARTRMVGAGKARISGRFRANEQSLDFYETRVTFGGSKLLAKLVSIGFDNSLVLDVPEGAVVNLADIGPLAGVEVSGLARLAVTMRGPAASAPLDADLSVDGLSLGGFPIGDIKSAKARFEPLHVDFRDLRVVKGTSEMQLPRARLGFDGPASVAFDAHVTSERLGVRDFLDVWNMGADPRYEEVAGSGRVDADVHYALGGPEDRCEGGVLKVDGRVALTHLELFGERYGGAEADLHLHWWDMTAGDNGYDLRVPSLALRKGGGAIVGSVEVHPGARLGGHLVASSIPLGSVDALGVYGRQWDGLLSGVARLGGTLDALAVTANVDVTALKQGRTQLPPSRLRVRFAPSPESSENRPSARSKCGNPISPPFDLAKYARDESRGEIHVDGELWGGQVTLEDLRISQQRQKRVAGTLGLHRLDLDSLLSPLPGAGSDKGFQGDLSGSLRLDHLWLDRPLDSEGELVLTGTDVRARGLSVQLASPRARLALRAGELTSEGLAWAVETPGGQRGVFDLNLKINRSKQVDAALALRDTNLGALAPLLPGVERAEGTLRARVTAQGPWDALRWGGSMEVVGGRLLVSRLDSPIEELELALGLDAAGLTIRKGSARLGGGTLRLSGTAPLVGTELGRVTLGLQARNVALPAGDGIRVAVDSDLQASFDPARGNDGQSRLPRLTGTVDVLSAEYRRPMSVTADLAALTARGKKTEVDAYDPSRDNLELDLLVRSTNPMRVENDLVEAQLRVDSGGLRISGTDQRYGAVGSVHLVPGGRVKLRRNAFEIRQGIVRFNDPTRVAPQVDVTATTEYRRYDDPSRAEGGQVASPGTGGATLGGTWRIHLHAYGEPENLRVDLTSDPALAQDDLFLLLTVGLTRAELDQTRSAGLGSSVALEALGTLSGADQAVTEAVPMIDDFRFGSAYSTRTGRTEPTVTIGKRLSERIRANVTTSLSDSSEVRSNLEWRMSPRVSVEGAYDNVKDIGSNALGNVGGDVRWRLEFE